MSAIQHQCVQPGLDARRHHTSALSRLLRRGVAAVAIVNAVAVQTAAAACSVSAQGVAFGSYDALAGHAVDGAGNIGVNCDSGASYAVALSSGNGTYAIRILRGASGDLDYNLYTDTSRLLVWGDGSGGSATVAGTGTGALTNIPVYGRIRAGQNDVRSGSYEDNVIVTITF